MKKIIKGMPKILVAIVCVAVAFSMSAQQRNRTVQNVQPQTQSQVVAQFVAPLNVKIPSEWERYAVEGIGKLDVTGVAISHKYLVNIFAALDSQDRVPYLLLIAEHFRNDYRQYKNMPIEQKIVASIPQAHRFVESANSVFDNIRSELITVYMAEIDEIHKRTQQRATPNGRNSSTNTRQERNYASSQNVSSAATRTIARASDNRSAIINDNKKRFTSINERTDNIDKKITALEQNIEIYKKRIAQLEAQQKPATPSPARPRQAWVQSFSASTTQQSKEDKQIKEITRIAQASERRLTTIENRVSRNEQELAKIDNSIEKIAATVAAKSEPTHNPQPRYVQPEKKQVIRINPASTKKTTTSAAIKHKQQTFNTFHPLNNTANEECSIEFCTSVEDWLMNWYNQYMQYPPDKQKSSKFLTALKDTKEIYDRQKQAYPKKLKYLLTKFELLPYKM